MSGFSHHDLLVEFFDGTISEKAIGEIESVLFVSAGSARPFQEAVKFRNDMSRLRAIANLKWEIFKDDDGCGLLVRDDEVALEYQQLTKEAQHILRKLIGPKWWHL